MVNYHSKKFKTSEGGGTTNETSFEYQQNENVLTSEYKGGKIIKGHLIGVVVDEEGNIDMRYHQVNINGQITTGTCQSKPKFMKNGKIRLHEKWSWTSRHKSSGQSILEEV